MINFSNYYCLVIVLIVKITTCQTNDSNTTEEIEDSDDFTGSADDVSGSDLKFVSDVCELPIDEGDCRNESLATDEGSDSDVSDNNDELYELNELNDLNELNESNTFSFGYNKSTKKCEQFDYDGCGGNANRFDTVNDCRNTCYTPLKNFLAKVTDLLVFRVTNGSKGTSELPTT